MEKGDYRMKSIEATSLTEKEITEGKFYRKKKESYEEEIKEKRLYIIPQRIMDRKVYKEKIIEKGDYRKKKIIKATSLREKEIIERNYYRKKND